MGVTERHTQLRGESLLISDLELFLVEIPRRELHAPCRTLLVRLATDSGHEGWGETGPCWSRAQLAARRDVLLPQLSGRSAFDVEELLRRDELQPAPLRAALEMACWDLVGQAADEPLCRLWGGMYRQHVPLAVRLPRLDVARTVNLAQGLSEEGYHCQVLQATGNRAVDRRLLESVTDAVSERATIRFDMAGTCDVQFAAEFCREISPELVQCVIDPLGPNDLAGLVPLSRQTNVPLAIAATVQSPSDVLRLASSGAAPWVVLDLQQLGGIWPTRLASAVAEAGQLTPLLRIPPSLGVGMAAMLQTVACTPAVALANESDFYQLQDDLLSEPIEMANGLAAVPQGPGLGIEVDRGKLERYLVN